MKKLILICGCLFTLCLGFLIVSFSVPWGKEGVLWIEKGATTASIASQMRQFHLPAHQMNLWLFKKLSGQTLQNGEYQLEPEWTLWQACTHVASGRVIMHKITFPEGWTIHQIIERVQAEPLLAGDVASYPEGSVLPETYYFARGDKRSDLLAKMQQDLNNFIQKEWPKRDSTITLTQNEFLVLASMVESETPKDMEKSIVAGVFYNRLAQNMKLQSDPTVAYALTQGKKKLDKPLTYDDLRVQSPFNTYHTEGLPPAPIACSGKASILAALHPQRHDFIYFVADGKGGHVFSQTFAEHTRNVQKWRLIKAANCS